MLRSFEQPLLHHFNANPFAVLAVTPRDNRERLVEAAEYRSLTYDPRQCLEARATLINPRTRLFAEIDWLVGVDHDQAGELLRRALEEPQSILAQKIPALSKLNLLLCAIPAGEQDDPLVDWIIAISDLYENIDLSQTQELINKNRSIAGFPKVHSLSLIKEALEQKRSFIGEKIKRVLDDLSPEMIVSVVTDVVIKNTIDVSERSRIIIDDVADIYELETRTFLKQQTANIATLIDHIKECILHSHEEIDTAFVNLEEAVHKWSRIALPARLNRQARGLSHGLSDRVFFEVRELAVFLFNHYELTDQARRLTDLLEEVFSESPEIVDQLHGDKATLDQLLHERRQTADQKRSHYQSLGDDIRFETEIGIVSKRTLKISPEGVQWKDRLWDLDTITRVRWGAVRLSIVNAPLRTQYVIIIGDQDNMERIVIGRKSIYQELIKRLWLGVCTRLMGEMLAELSEGRKLHFHNTVVDDYGIQLLSTRTLRDKSAVYVTWSDVEVTSDDGRLNISLLGNSAVCAILPYTDVDNVNLLEAIIRRALEKECTQLSQILE